MRERLIIQGVVPEATLPAPLWIVLNDAPTVAEVASKDASVVVFAAPIAASLAALAPSMASPVVLSIISSALIDVPIIPPIMPQPPHEAGQTSTSLVVLIQSGSWPEVSAAA